MKISAKARYGLAAVVYIAVNYGHNECVTIISISEHLKISKIYLEQVFSLLKRGGIVTSTKGAQGGYQLARVAADITAYDILSSIETTLFETVEDTVAQSNENIEKAMGEVVFLPLNTSILDTLKKISLEEICDKATQYSGNEGYMYYL